MGKMQRRKREKKEALMALSQKVLRFRKLDGPPKVSDYDWDATLDDDQTSADDRSTSAKQTPLTA